MQAPFFFQGSLVELVEATHGTPLYSIGVHTPLFAFVRSPRLPCVSLYSSHLNHCGCAEFGRIACSVYTALVLQLNCGTFFIFLFFRTAY
jgi:hypothetical protein